MAGRRWTRPTREDVHLALLVLIVAVGAVITIGGVLVARTFEPQDGLIGRPTRLSACGRNYDGDRENRTWTRVQVDESMSPGATPVIFEPVIGLLPLFAPLSGTHDFNGVQLCDTVVFVHVGPDAYAPYALEGGG